MHTLSICCIIHRDGDDPVNSKVVFLHALCVVLIHFPAIPICILYNLPSQGKIMSVEEHIKRIHLSGIIDELSR